MCVYRRIDTYMWVGAALQNCELQMLSLSKYQFV